MRQNKPLFLVLLFLFLAGCHREPWQHTSIRSGDPNYDMAKLSYPSTDGAQGIELELTRCGKEIFGYIYVHQFDLPSVEPNVTTLTIATNSTSRTFTLPLLQGSQKARLTDECLEYLLQTLTLKPSVTLSSGYFTQTIDATRFEQHYQALLRKPLLPHPRSMISFELF